MQGGKPLEREEQQNLQTVIEMFAKYIEADYLESLNADPDVYSPEPTKANKAIIDALDGAYRDDVGAMFLVSDKPDFIVLLTYLTQAPTTIFLLLHDKLELRLIDDPARA